MSADTRPITPTRFSAAIKELSPSTLHLKLAEIRNSIAHLEYSNFQLKPYADGTETALGLPPATTSAVPDQDCADAIRENEAVIARMQERVELIRDEVEERGLKWEEFDTRPKSDGNEAAPTSRTDGQAAQSMGAVNGRAGAVANGDGTRHAAWSDGTFQAGVVRSGDALLLRQDIPSQSAAATAPGARGGTLGDEALRLAVEERMRELDDDEDAGLHL